MFELVLAPLFTFVFHMLSKNINGKLNPINTRWQIQCNPWYYILFSNIFIFSKQWWFQTNNNTDIFAILSILYLWCMWIERIRVWNLCITNWNRKYFVLFFLFSKYIRTIQVFMEIFLSCLEVFLANNHQEQTIYSIWMFSLQI